MSWQPNVGKWYDEDYDIKEPLWRKLLEVASQYGDIKKLQQILSWFNKKNMHGDSYKIILIGCFLKQFGFNFDEYIDEHSLSVIAEMTTDPDTIENCAMNLLKKENVAEEFIDEFKTQFAERN